MLANSAVRGTIRSGQMGQLSDVIQSGGEDGMWSFDRYQRWMAQHKDWLRPAFAPMANDAGPAPRAAPLKPPLPAVLAPPKPVAKPMSGAGSENPGEIVIDEDLDLGDIAELAKRIERRTS